MKHPINLLNFFHPGLAHRGSIHYMLFFIGNICKYLVRENTFFKMHDELYANLYIIINYTENVFKNYTQIPNLQYNEK